MPVYRTTGTPSPFLSDAGIQDKTVTSPPI